MSQKFEQGKSNIYRVLWKRKLYYLAGLILTLLVLLLNIGLGAHITVGQLVVLPLSCSFMFGFMIYVIIKEPTRLKKEGRTIFFEREGLIHLGLTFGTMIVSGIIMKLLGYSS